MPVLNPGFEDAGTRPGEAAHWTLVSSVAGERIAGFGPDPYCAWEDFERWFELLVSWDQVSVATAFFDLVPQRHEDFEEGWDNDIFLFELPSGQVEAFDFGGEAAEAFESAWENDGYAESWDAVPAVAGMFDAEAREDFEEQWSSNQSYAWAWSSVTSATAMFDGGAQGREDFENDWTAATTI
jgi:hypothetical protein